MGAVSLLSRQVAVLGADGKGRGQGEVGEPVLAAYGSDKGFDRLGINIGFPHKAVDHRAPGILGLQWILVIQEGKNIVCIVDG